MLLSEKFKFGKYKGKTLQEVLNIEAGVDWLWWYVEQPCTNMQFASYDKTRKDAIKRKLHELAGTHMSTSDSVGIAMCLAVLERIEKKLDTALEYVSKDNVPVRQVEEEPVAQEWEE